MIKVIIRCIFWLPYSRILNVIVKYILNFIDNEPIRTRYGFNMYWKKSGSHSSTLRKSMIVGQHEREYLSVIKNYINDGDVVVDVGAHEGYFSLFMEMFVRADGKVHAFEPNVENRWFLHRNISNNVGLTEGNIDASPRAISNFIGETDFYYDDDMGAWGSLTDHSYYDSWLSEKKTVKMEVDTLDNIFEDYHRRIAFIKIDTEGNEFNVFQGAKNILFQHRPVICFEVNLIFWSYNNYSISDMFDFLKDCGYTLHILKNGSLKPFDYLDRTLVNLFAIPKELEKYQKNSLAGYLDNLY